MWDMTQPIKRIKKAWNFTVGVWLFYLQEHKSKNTIMN